MKRFFIFLLLFAGMGASMSQGGYNLTCESLGTGLYKLAFTLNDYQLEEFTAGGETFTRISFESSVYTNKKGWAALPYVGASVMLANRNVDMQVTAEAYEDITLTHPLLPSRGVITRDQDPSKVPYVIDPRSVTEAWYPGQAATSSGPFILRDLRGISVFMYPFQYDALHNTLRIIKEFTVLLVENNSPVVNPLPKEPGMIAREMDGVYRSVFINYDQTMYDLTIGNYGDILVVTTSRDEAAIEPYMQWKREKGYNVTKEVVATGTNVKTNVLNAYNANNNLLYVQLVGDWADIKCDLLSGYAPMDPQLGCVIGSDQYPDICVGRFSAGSPAQVTIQVNKSIAYEQNPDLGGSWYGVSTGVASNQGPGDDNELDYQHIQNIYDNKLHPFTYDTQNQIYEPSATIQMVKNAVNGGTSIINYCGHGSPTSWGTTGFSNGDVATLTNGNKLPVIFSVACNNGNFHDPGDCFAEAWVKKENGGAIMFLGGTISQPWDPPMRGQDYFNDMIVGGYDYTAHPGQNGISTTEGRMFLGPCVYNGLVLMTTEATQAEDWETAKTWTYFGDIALQMRTDQPADLTVSNEVILVGVPYTTTITGNGGPVEGAMVCLSQGNAYFSGITDVTGTVSITNTLVPGTAKLCVTGYNAETIYQDITVVPPSGPWVMVFGYALDDSQGNNNGLADYGESILLDVTAKNVGSDPASGVSSILSTTDPYITITDNSHSFGNIAAGATITGTGAFAFEVAGNAPDGHTAILTVTFTDEGKPSWTSNIIITLHAPILEVGGFTLNDQGGNGNGKLDPGETVLLSIEVLNSGTSQAMNVAGVLSSSDPFITISQNTASYGNINGGQTGEQPYTVSASIATPQGHASEFFLGLTANLGITAGDSLTLIVGQIPVLIVDLDGNGNSAPAIQQALSANNITADMTSTLPASLDLYASMFVCLGVYSDNHVLTDDEGQALADFLSNGGRLYMEGGDTWYYDDPTPVHTMFKIIGSADGSSDLSVELGQTGTFTEGMTFTYSGENNWIDHIDPIAPAVQIFKNQSPVYGTAVAYEAANYKTIGASFEFGGLNDGQSPSTKADLMEKIIDFFDLATISLQAYFTASDTEICEGDEVSFTDASLGNVTSWYWEFPGGTPATSSDQNPEVVYNTAGVYDVILTISDGTDSSTFVQEDYITVLVCTGIDERNAASFVLYPNPGDGNLTLVCGGDAYEGIDLRVLSTLGRVVYEQKDLVPDADRTVDLFLGWLEEGVYFIEIIGNHQKTIEKIVIRK